MMIDDDDECGFRARIEEYHVIARGTYNNRNYLQKLVQLTIFWPFSGPFRVQKIIFSFRKIFTQYSVPYRTRNPWHSEH